MLKIFLKLRFGFPSKRTGRSLVFTLQTAGQVLEDTWLEKRVAGPHLHCVPSFGHEIIIQQSRTRELEWNTLGWSSEPEKGLRWRPGPT